MCALPQRGAGNYPSYPPMNTPREWPAVSTYHQHLVVAGGSGESDTDLATVEILDTSVSHSQWLSATLLPLRCHRMSAAIIHGTLYLLGGSLASMYLACLSQPLHKLTSHPHSGAHFPMSRWSTLRPSLSMDLCWQMEEARADNEALPFMSTTRRRTCGTRWGTYLLNEHVVRAVCYRVERSLLLEEVARLAEWT